MEATIISLQTTHVGNDNQHMTSLEIAEVTGKQHKHVMEAIRKMEPAWVKVNGSNFRLVEYRTRKASFALATRLRKPSAFTSPRSSTTRLAPSWSCAGKSWSEM